MKQDSVTNERPDSPRERACEEHMRDNTKTSGLEDLPEAQELCGEVQKHLRELTPYVCVECTSCWMARQQRNGIVWESEKRSKNPWRGYDCLNKCKKHKYRKLAQLARPAKKRSRRVTGSGKQLPDVNPISRENGTVPDALPPHLLDPGTHIFFCHV